MLKEEAKIGLSVWVYNGGKGSLPFIDNEFKIVELDISVVRIKTLKPLSKKSKSGNDIYQFNYTSVFSNPKELNYELSPTIESIIIDLEKLENKIQNGNI